MTARETAMAIFAAEGLTPSEWSAAPGHDFPEHVHDRTKLLICIEGEISFHLAADDVTLRPGDRLDLPAGTVHAATAGPDGVTCMESFR